MTFKSLVSFIARSFHKQPIRVVGGDELTHRTRERYGDERQTTYKQNGNYADLIEKVLNVDIDIYYQWNMIHSECVQHRN